MKMNDVRIEVGGTLFGGWTSVKISAGITKMARDFIVAFTRTSKAGGITMGVRPGDSVKVFIDDDLVLTGYVTGLDTAYSATTVTLTMKGFSRTIDLCDCQVPAGAPLSFKRTPIHSIVSRLAAHYGIEVERQVPGAQTVDWDVSPTETVMSTLEKMLKQHTMLLSDNALGELVLLEAGSGGIAADELKTGGNILTATYSIEAKGLYSDYVVLGQGANSQSERPVTDAQSMAVSRFSGIRRRVFVTKQSGDATVAELQRRAKLLRDYAVGSSETYRCTVQGWRQSNGMLWKPNSMVRVIDSYFELDRYFVIGEVSFSLSRTGTTTDLLLKPLGSYIETAELPKKDKEAAKSRNNLVHKGMTKDSAWTSNNKGGNNDSF